MTDYYFDYQDQRISMASPGMRPGYLDELRNLVWKSNALAGRILEWGAGLSTLMLADILLPGGTIATVDDNLGYLEAVLKALPKGAPVLGIHADSIGPRRSQEDPELAYSTIPIYLAPGWNLIVIDGRRRQECALTAAMLAGPETRIALHDFRRLRYEPLVGLFDVIEDGEHYRFMKPKSQVQGAMAHVKPRMDALIRNQKLSPGEPPSEFLRFLRPA